MTNCITYLFQLNRQYTKGRVQQNITKWNLTKHSTTKDNTGQQNKTTQQNTTQRKTKQNTTQRSVTQQNTAKLTTETKHNTTQQNTTQHRKMTLKSKERTGNKSFTASNLCEVSKDHPIKAAYVNFKYLFLFINDMDVN